MGYATAWLGFGSAALGDLRLAERALDNTASITVATAIVNMWTNDADVVADAYHRIAARHRGRFLLGMASAIPNPSPPTGSPTTRWRSTSTPSTPPASPRSGASWPLSGHGPFASQRTAPRAPTRTSSYSITPATTADSLARG